MLSGGNKVYSEVEGMQLLLQYQVRSKVEELFLFKPPFSRKAYAYAF